MYLIKKDIDVKELKFNICFEKVADDLLMIMITNQKQNAGIASYWRLTKVLGIPPLEIGIDCETKYLQSITFYMDLSYINKSNEIKISLNRGNVLIDTSIFKNVNDYIDIDEDYKIYIQGSKLICAFKQIDEWSHSFQNDRLELYVDTNSQIIGLSICDLTDDEIKIIHSLK